MNWDTGTWDSGFWDQPSIPVNQPPQPLKKMRRQAYYPSKIADQITWLENFRNKLPGYQAALGLSAGQVTAAVADARWLVHVMLTWQPAVKAWAQAATDAVALALSGDGTALMALPVFTAPALPAGVTATNTGALNRLFALVQAIKATTGYTEAVGTDLGLVGAQQTAPDLATIRPEFSVSLQGTQPFIDWKWDGNSAFLDMMELQVDRNDGKGWQPLAFDTTPGYLDTAPLPAVPTKWKYRGIYRVGDHPVGVWSNEVSIIVGG
jgi:hypothetical protein